MSIPFDQQQPAAGVAARYFFDPEELRAAAEAGFEAFMPITLHMVDSDEGARHFINAGFKEPTNLQQHNTRESGLSNLPSRTAPPSDDTASTGPALHDLPAPTGDVNGLPSGMPPIRVNGTGSIAARVVEIFEEKVVDEVNNKVWHPLHLWDEDIRARYGYTDSANLTTRLNAYYAAKCGEIDSDALVRMTFTELKKEGRKYYTEKYGVRGGPGYFKACNDLLFR